MTEQQLLGPQEIRDLATQLGIRPTKTLGQNFVIDPNTIRRIVSVAKIGADETVLEVGPGLGSLTLGILDVARDMVAIEIDPPLAQQLPHTIATFRSGSEQRIDVVLNDALKVFELPKTPTALVANLPYNVAVPVLLHLFAQFPSIEHALVMVQDEVADRLSATPGSKIYGVPSVKANWFCEVQKAGVIGTNVFWPAPKIKSGLVAFTRRAQPLSDVPRELVFAIIDAAFAQRRKTLRAALATWAGSSALAGQVLDHAGVDSTLRGEKLDIHDFVKIAESAHELNIGEKSDVRTIAAEGKN
ncbi:MAG: 16S rRNA (adenine(1518)-N(6)/adenine(1519)-N(6))-dimethyltransferase RsmA [Rothia sp. (in: high G+C Gram-positive bacteria)]|nr:16S rRNA (adenine(1518)-N(6)/adenine(1519)-N(6))-dimethyltransferase RsmA [Rothia sp. (in: high G+C Gram-positive bacteria)]